MTNVTGQAFQSIKVSESQGSVRFAVSEFKNRMVTDRVTKSPEFKALRLRNQETLKLSNLETWYYFFSSGTVNAALHVFAGSSKTEPSRSPA